MKGILGQKIGMSQIFLQDGRLLPITVVNIANNVVTQVKTVAKDGYDALQIGYYEKKKQRSNRPLDGHFNKAKATPKRFVKEIRGMNGFELGESIKVSTLFQPGDIVDVTGISKGKGFAGVIKRHNQAIGPKAHGSGFHRQIGSMGDIEGNKISKGKKMPGQMGHVQRTTQNLEIVEVNDEENYLLVKGRN